MTGISRCPAKGAHPVDTRIEEPLCVLHKHASFVRPVKAEEGGADDSGAWWNAPVATVGVVVPAIVYHAHGFGGFRG